MKQLRSKFRSRRGMSLAETLVAVVLLGLLSMTVAMGVGTATRLYTKSVTYSEAQTLASTLSQALTDELRYALHMSSDEGTVMFDSRNYGVGISVTNDNGTVKIGGSDLIPSKAYTNGLKAKADVSYASSSGLFTVKLKIYTGSDSGSADSLSETTLQIRALNAGGTGS